MSKRHDPCGQTVASLWETTGADQFLPPQQKGGKVAAGASPEAGGVADDLQPGAAQVNNRHWIAVKRVAMISIVRDCGKGLGGDRERFEPH